jgi:hypothetical protein
MVLWWNDAKKQNMPLMDHPRAFWSGVDFEIYFYVQGPFAGLCCFEMPIAEPGFNKPQRAE